MTFLTNFLESVVRSCVDKSAKTCDFTGYFEQFLELVPKAEYSIYDKNLPNPMRRNALLGFEAAGTPIELTPALRGREEEPYVNPRTGRNEWEQFASVSAPYNDSPAMLTADEKPTVEDIFFGTKVRKGVDKSLTEIIEEKSASCLVGFQTSEKTAKILNKRVKNEIR